MASDLETNVRTALENLSSKLANATELTVHTSYKLIDAAHPNVLNALLDLARRRSL